MATYTGVQFFRGHGVVFLICISMGQTHRRTNILTIKISFNTQRLCSLLCWRSLKHWSIFHAVMTEIGGFLFGPPCIDMRERTRWWGRVQVSRWEASRRRTQSSWIFHLTTTNARPSIPTCIHTNMQTS